MRWPDSTPPSSTPPRHSPLSARRPSSAPSTCSSTALAPPVASRPAASPGELARRFETNLVTYVNVFDPAAKRMAARGRGVVVNVIGNGGKVAAPTHLVGGAANAALMLATAGQGQVYTGCVERV